MRCALVVFLVSLAACSPGPGRTPVFPDATVRPDAGFEDARVYPDATPHDAGPPDSEVVLFDAGPPPQYEFSGIFGVLNSNTLLYAREVDDAINLVFDDYPYVYTGTITASGEVEASSLPLAKLGCQRALVYGHYDRVNATYVMTHETCNFAGDPLFSNIRGGFLDNFDPVRSGIYEFDATVIGTGGCWVGPMEATVRYGVQYFSPGNAITIFTAVDIIPQAMWYRGGVENDAFSARDEAFSVQLNGAFSQRTAQDPLELVMMRDIWDPRNDCGFTISLEGARVVAP